MMNFSRLLACSVLLLVASATTAVGDQTALRTPAGTTVESGSPANLNSRFPETSVENIFNAIATRIRFEPYRGVLRGADGTALAGSGNSLDQSMLLAQLLRRQGYTVRFVAGSLTGKNRSILLRGLFPPRLPALSLTADYAPFDPYMDASLLKLVQDHYWLEVRQADGWLPLDPSFPRAVVGEAYGVAKSRMDQPAEGAYVIFKLLYKRQLLSGEVEVAAKVEERAADIALRPISLIEVMVPLQATVEKEKKAATRGTFGGALAGSSQAPLATEAPGDEQALVVGAAYEWRFDVPDRGTTSGTSVVLDQKSESCISREWLEFEIRVPGMAPRKVTRTLFRDSPGGGGSKPPAFSHYTISLFNGPVSQQLVRQRIDKANKGFSLAALQRSIDNMRADPEAASTGEALALEQELGTKLLHILNVRFAAESDALSDMGAYRSGLALVRSTPRILISSLVAGEPGYSIAMDLRLDEVTAIPFPGAPARLVELFQTGRGFQNSVLEGKILEYLGGKPAVTTARLMEEASRQDAALLAVNARNFSQFAAQSDIPQDVAGVIKPYLNNGGEVIIAAEPVALDGRKRWGWWAMDPDSGRVIGVMDDGRHQAMIQYTIDTNEIGLNPKSGFVVGAIVGASSTLFVVAAKILEYGEITGAMVDDVEKYLKAVSDSFCPGASATVAAGASHGGDCVKVELKAGVDAVSMNFCSKFADGFKCTAGMLLGAMRGETAPYAISAEINTKTGTETTSEKVEKKF